MRVLVAGADRVDAGKTTFSVGLCARLGATGFKPRAGNDLWFDHDDVRMAVSAGRLYGKDARRLAEASPGDPDPEDLNPVHRLWRPDPGPGKGLVGQADRRFLLDRVAGSFLVNAHGEVPGFVREGLPLEDAVTVDSVAELNRETRRRHLPALGAVAKRIRGADPAVVESYGDVARPLEGTLGEEGDPPTEAYDAVAVVEPARVRVYDGERYVRACEVAGSGPRDGSLERRVPDVIEHLEAVATHRLPPLSGEERDDPGVVAGRYRAAYDSVVDAATA
jgi:predicted P-loop ATPase/GTPase